MAARRVPAHPPRDGDRRTHLVVLDESGFALTPTRRRTPAPRGRTPVLPAWDRRDRLSAVSATTLSPVAHRPNPYFDLYPRTIHGEEVAAFLADSRRRLGPPTVVWDRGPIPGKAKVVRAWPAEHPRVATGKFPGSVPDLNPDEGCGVGPSTGGWPTRRQMTRTSCGTI